MGQMWNLNQLFGNMHLVLNFLINRKPCLYTLKMYSILTHERNMN